jgi:hypothetical protein
LRLLIHRLAPRPSQTWTGQIPLSISRSSPWFSFSHTRATPRLRCRPTLLRPLRPIHVPPLSGMSSMSSSTASVRLSRVEACGIAGHALWRRCLWGSVEVGGYTHVRPEARLVAPSLEPGYSIRGQVTSLRDLGEEPMCVVGVDIKRIVFLHLSGGSAVISVENQG